MAFVIYRERYKGRLSEVISPDKALSIRRAQLQPTGLTKAQAEYIANVKGVYLSSPSQSWQKGVTRRIEPVQETIERRYK